MIRTRAITDKLPYDMLVKDGIIPDLLPLINQSKTTITTKKYPPFVYAVKDYAFFGMLLDYIIRAGLRINLQQKIELGTDPVVQNVQNFSDDEMINIATHINIYETSSNIYDIAKSALILTSTLYGKTSYDQEQIQNYIPTIINIIKELIIKWNLYGMYLNGVIRFNTEYSHKEFAGHPDVVTDKCVLDIKTTGSFPKMAKQSCLQVLAYYALMKLVIPSIEYVGFILPMQRDIVIYNVSNWDSSRYLELLSIHADKLVKNTQPKLFESNLPGSNVIVIEADNIESLLTQLLVISPSGDSTGILGTKLDNTSDKDKIKIAQDLLGKFFLEASIIEPLSRSGKFKIGGHISKGKNIEITLRDFTIKCPGLPCQMFLVNARSGRKNATLIGQLEGANKIIKETGLKYYTHAPYVINLCANQCDDSGDYWQQRILNENLDYTVAMGGRGVVVHTGARKKMSEESALSVMEHMVKIALTHATEQCPLLLETPCGEGTEVCSKIEDFGNFFFRFSTTERNKLGVCIDTAHIHAAGYDPLLYLQHWEKFCPVEIKLVHYNDAAVPCGSHVDRHAPPGHGYIGEHKMRMVAEWCYERNIPMVHE